LWFVVSVVHLGCLAVELRQGDLRTGHRVGHLQLGVAEVVGAEVVKVVEVVEVVAEVVAEVVVGAEEVVMVVVVVDRA